MPASRERIVASLRARDRRSPLTTADRYLRTLSVCFEGGPCPGLDVHPVSRDEWRQSLKEAETKLVYCDPSADVVVSEARSDVRQPATDGAILDFEAVVTTTSLDRDGDVLESAGAIVDPRAVLLWQHVPFQPIGKLVRVVEQTDAHVKAQLSIADTELGRDAATLAAFGAVKISHGFEPIEFEPLRHEGWHIKRFEIFEISLVSVPSNREAVITAYSRHKLHSPLVREWAGRAFRNRPAVAGGFRASDRTRSVRSSGSKRGSQIPADESLCRCATSTELVRNEPAFSRACAAFVAKATFAGGNDVETLRQTRDVLTRLIDRIESGPATA